MQGHSGHPPNESLLPLRLSGKPKLAPPPGLARPLATVSIDLDDCWTYLRSFGRSDWDGHPSILPSAIAAARSLLGEAGITASFFVVGRDAECAENLPWLLALANDGHEIGNHSHHHDLDLHHWAEAKIHSDLARSARAIEAVTGAQPVGFRGPGYGVSPNLLRVLQQLGYRYDGSMFSSRVSRLASWYQSKLSSRGGEPGGSRPEPLPVPPRVRRSQRPFRWVFENQSSLLELPVTTWPGLELPIHMTYLNWLAGGSVGLARAYFDAAARRARRRGVALSFLLHAVDFIDSAVAPGLVRFPGMGRGLSVKLGLLRYVLAVLKAQFEVVTLAELADGMARTPGELSNVFVSGSAD